LVLCSSTHLLTPLSLTVSSTHLDCSEPVPHAVFGNHTACNACRSLEVIMHSCRNFTEGDFFRNTASEQTDDFIFELRLRHEVTVFFRKHYRITASLAARNDCNFVHCLRIIQNHTNNCVARFVISDNISFFLTHDTALLSRTCNNTV